MGLINAFKAFFKALKDPKAAESFLKEKKAETVKTPDNSHLRLLTLLQQSGRLLDFLKEDITPYSDAQVGAAVRGVHMDCHKILEDYVCVRPVFEENEGATIQVPKGFDPSKIKIVGAVKGEAPYTGRLVHRGWQAKQAALPKQLSELNTEVLCPAEVEVR